MAVILNGTVSPSWQDYAAAGRAFIASNPTPGTAIQCGTVTAFSATADGLFTLSNGNASGGASLRMNSLVLNMTGTAPTATTQMKMAFYVEQGIVAPSAGNSAVVPRNALLGGPASAGTLNVFVNAMCTIPAAVGTRQLAGNVSIPTNLGITGDTYVVKLDGTQPDNGAFSVVVRATVPSRFSAGTAAPIIIAPQQTLIADWWWVGQATSGPLFEYEISWAETT
jgi:hypothetical protein